MGREARRVPADWQHPKDEDGHYVPLFEDDYETAVHEWHAEREKWAQSEASARYPHFEDWHGKHPDSREYMPKFDEETATHYMMYETTSEGTPISPAFATPEELARWLADTGASAFGGMTADYEHWLRVARGGWACSAVVIDGEIQSGVQGLPE